MICVLLTSQKKKKRMNDLHIDGSRPSFKICGWMVYLPAKEFWFCSCSLVIVCLNYFAQCSINAYHPSEFSLQVVVVSAEFSLQVVVVSEVFMADQQAVEGSSTSNDSGGSSESTVVLNIKTLDSQTYTFNVDKNVNFVTYSVSVVGYAEKEYLLPCLFSYMQSFLKFMLLLKSDFSPFILVRNNILKRRDLFSNKNLLI